jgi:DNA-binding transcriptional regulator YhcF (GntR family)
VISLDAASPIPPFEQVRSQLARKITNGSLAVGTRLPTVRSLATELGLAVNTVARAFRELEHSGLVETRGRAGTFVSAGGDRGLERARDAARQYAATIRELGIDTEAALRIVRAALAPE